MPQLVCEIPRAYDALADQERRHKIAEAKRLLGERLLILGHHYQRDEVIEWADLTGDSFKLSRLAAERPEAEYIVFCGVHFMAESADILSADHQQVILPDLSAGCSMADMADIDQVETCWAELEEVCGDSVLPITYVNSTAEIKAFVGRHGGACCTSSNARAVMEWAFARKPKLLFFPDQHLGRNTAAAMGVPLDEMAVWNPDRELGGCTAEQLAAARVILWQGHCSVHQTFTIEQIESVRAEDPEMRVLVHPECPYEVVQQADEVGSTEFIIRTVEESAPGARWAIGTEIHLVHRLANRHVDKTIVSLNPNVCVCATMFRIDPEHLAWALDSLLDGEVVNRIAVAPEVKQWARVALDRMLSIT